MTSPLLNLRSHPRRVGEERFKLVAGNLFSLVTSLRGMRGRIATVLGALALFASPPTGVGVNPLDDDAGTGADAGDSIASAMPITPGRYQGNLTGPPDGRDVYAFEAQKGQLLRLLVENDRGMYMAVIRPGDLLWDVTFPGLQYDIAWPGLPIKFPIPYTGTWWLGIGDAFAMQVPLAYEFEYALEPLDELAVLDGPAPSHVLEVRADSPVDLLLYSRVQTEPDSFAPTTALLFEEFDADLVGHGPAQGFALLTMMGGGTVGTSLQVSPGPLPPQQIPRTDFWDGASGVGIVTIRFKDVTGAFRLVAYSTDANTTFLLMAEADGPIEHVGSSDAPVLVWSEDNSGAAVQVVTPAGGFTGERDLPLDVPSRFVGTLQGHGFTHTATDPEGRTFEIDGFNDVAYIRDARPGAWNFHVEPTPGVGPALDFPARVAGTGASRHFLDGVQVPGLGVAPLTLLPRNVWKDVCDPECEESSGGP